MTPTPSTLSKVLRRHAAVQMGCCFIGVPFKLRSLQGTAIQMGGILPCKLEAYCSTLFETCRGVGVSETLILAT